MGPELLGKGWVRLGLLCLGSLWRSSNVSVWATGHGWAVDASHGTACSVRAV